MATSRRCIQGRAGVLPSGCVSGRGLLTVPCDPRLLPAVAVNSSLTLVFLVVRVKNERPFAADMQLIIRPAVCLIVPVCCAGPDNSITFSFKPGDIHSGASWLRKHK